MPNTGWVSPGTVTGVSWTASDAGTLLNAVTSDDNVWAQSAGSNTNYLTCSNFGMSIPGGSTIEGLEVRIRCSVVGAYVGTAKIGCEIGKVIATPLGNELTDVFTGYPPDVDVVFGSAVWLWETSFTVGEVNDTGLSVYVRLASDSVMVSNYQVDQVQMRVHYSEGGAVGVLTSGMGQMTYDPGIGVTPLRGAVSKER